MTTESTRKFVVLYFVVILRVSCEVDYLPSHEKQNFFEGSQDDDDFNVTDAILEDPSDVLVNISITFNEKEFLPEVDQYSLNCSDFSRGFCIDTKNYPSEYIKTKLKSVPRYHSYFSSHVRKAVTFRRQPSYVVRTPVSPLDAGEPLCVSISKSVYLKAAKNTENNWRFIVNQENFTQAVRVETCLKEGEVCEMAMMFPVGYRSECRQEFSPRVLLAVNKDGDILPDVFNMPSCCKCVLYRE